MPAQAANHRPASLSPERQDFQVFRRLALALLVLASAAPLALNLVDPDLWGHVRYGQDWIAEGSLPRTATHTYTAEGRPWVNHENLAEWLLAHGFATLGVQGMLAAKTALGLGILILMSRAARRQGVRSITAWGCFLLVAHNLHAFFPMRPQVLSFLWLAVMLLLLDRAFAGWGSRQIDFQHTRRQKDQPVIAWRWLFAMPVLMVVWANSHGGFAAGLAVLGVFLLGRSLELLIRQGRTARRPAAGLVVVLAASGLATLFNPYGYKLHVWLLGSLGQPRPEITEWAPPTLGSPVFCAFALLVIVAITALAVTDRRRDPIKLLLLALAAWQAASHLRHIALFAILCGFWLPPHIQSLVTRLRKSAETGQRTPSPPGRMRVVLGASLAGAIALQATYLGNRIADLPVPRDRYPVDAIQWMADQGVKGRLFVSFNWAQYAIAAMAPDMKVAFDGRFRTCYPQEVIDRHFDFLIGDTWPRSRSESSGPIDGRRALEIDAPDYLLVDRRFPHAVKTIEQLSAEADSAWALIYQDATALLYGRRALVDDPELASYVPEARRLVSSEPLAGSVTWPALPRRGALPTPQSPREVAVAPKTENHLTPEG